MKRLLMIIVGILITLYLLLGLGIYLAQEKFLFHPEASSNETTYHFESEFEERFFETPNNGRIHALHFKVKNPKGIVLYSHGNAGNLERWGEVNYQFTERDYDVLIYDFRNYGKSTGDWSEENFCTDLQHIYDVLKLEYGEDKIVLFGRSMGSGPSTFIAAENNPKALILETPYYSVAEVAKGIMPIYPVKSLLKYKFENYKHINNINCSIHIIHGTADQVVPYSSAKKLYNQNLNKINFVTIDRGYHSNLSAFEVYYEFLDDCL